MKSKASMILFAWSAVSFQKASEGRSYAIDNSTRVSATISNQELVIDIDNSTVHSEQRIPIESEKSIELKIDDFNFDNINDLATSHLDEGHGLFVVSRIFVYSKTERRFLERGPDCGDAFLNLRLNKSKKLLISTYFNENEPKLCITRLR